MPSFVHLHVHSHYSVLDGMATIPGLVDKAIKNGMNAIALTDHGNMFGIKEFFDYTNKKNGGVKDKIKEIKTKISDIESEKIEVEDKDSEITKLKAEQSETEKKLFKPIIGCEVYVARRTRFDKSTKEDGSGHHLVLLAKNKKGYQNLCKLVSHGWIEGYYYRPRIDKDILKEYSEGLIVASACLGGEIHKKIEAGQLEDAEKAILWFKELFGEDYYIELQRHKTDKPGADREVYEKQRIQNEDLIKLARKTNTKIIATNDVHFVEEEHAEAHDRLICLSTGKDLDDQNRMRYTKQEWLKTPEEMYRIFSDIPEVFENTQEIADKVEFFSIDSGAIMPTYIIDPEFGTEEEYKAKYSEEDLRQEFGDRFDKLGGLEKIYRIKLEADYLKKITLEGAKLRYGENIDEETMERILFELDTMKTMGFPGYFLIVQDFIAAARKMGVSVGPGRGSAAGSVVAYCLRITDIDPLKYDLLFERFLNPDRISMPDIDIDFDDDGRGKVLRWVTDKYGKEKVAQIITYGTMATKSAIKDVARVQKLELREAERLAKLVPDKFPEVNGKAPKVNITNCIEKVPELNQARFSNDENLSNTLKYAEMLEGTVRQTGMHACGVIIGADDLTNFCPLSIAKDKESGQDVLVTQYEGRVIEDVGLIKMDFLGLKTLSIINEALKNIKKSKGDEVDIDNIPIDDKKTYELYSKGLTTGTFQFESPGMQQHLRALQPTQFEDLIAMNALYRPGPMQYIPSFVNRKHGREKIEYDIPIMENRLKDTYGITVYQEQVMLLSRDLAGFTRGQSDELRKAMGKKLIDKMAALKTKFIEGATKKGHDPKILEKIWNDWAEFAKYAFNKSHATCYSWISYQTAYLKAHYPGEFMAANLTRNKDNITEISKFMDECRNLGIMVMGPDVNESELNFTTNKDGHIRFGLGGVKGVGEGAVEQIVKEREQNGPFKSIFDFVERVNLSTCNRKNIESLALSGAFDNFREIKREDFFDVNNKGEQFSEVIIRYGNKYQADSTSSAMSLFGDDMAIEIAKPEIPKSPHWSRLERLNKEKDLVGIYISAHPLDSYKFEINHICNVQASELRRDNLETLKDKKEIRVGGLVTSIRHGRTKTDKPYGVFTIEDYSGAGEIALFGDDYINYQKFMIPDAYLLISGKVQERGADWKFRPKTDPNSPKEYEFKILKIHLLQDAKDKFVNQINLDIELDKITKEFCDDFLKITADNKGNVSLYLDVCDGGQTMELFARDRQIMLSQDMLNYFYLNEKLDNFKVKSS